MRNDVFKEVKKHMDNNLKINFSELSRRMNCNRRTVTRYISNTPERKSRNVDKLIDPFKGVIIEKIENYSVSAKSLFNFIKKKGYEGGYKTVQIFVREHKKFRQKEVNVRFESSPGDQAQIDWKEEFKLIDKNGKIYKINIFLFILGFSRKKYIVITHDRKQDTLFRNIINAFKSINGIPENIWFDNMKTVVDIHDSRIGNLKINQKMHQFANDMNFNIKVCKPYRPQTKGKVEVLAKLMERLRVYNSEFETIEELNEIVDSFNIELNEEICQAINNTPNKYFEKEKCYLKTLPSKIVMDSYLYKKINRKVQNDSMITFDKKRYSVHPKYVGKEVEIELNEESIIIKYDNSQISRYKISNKHLNYNFNDLKEILKSNTLKHKSDEDISQYAKEYLINLDRAMEARNDFV